MSADKKNPEVTLDPQDWEAFRGLAHKALDEAITYLKDVRERPVWQKMPPEARAHFSAALPLSGTPLEIVYDEFTQQILPYATGNIHPRFFGWVHGAGLAGNIVAEIMAAAMNSNCGGRDHGAIYVERQIVAWVRELFQFPAEAAGLIVSGSSMANLIALGTARNAAQEKMRVNGLRHQPRDLVAYTSSEAHISVVKAMEILGLGGASLRKIPVRADFTMDVAALAAAIADDRKNNLQPFCVIGCAGTVNTGAIDPLEELADLCAREKLWLHVDGAFGALCMTSEKLQPRLKGIERADSLAFDFHKWAQVQYDGGFVMVRNGQIYRDAYSTRPDYLHTLERGLGAGSDWPADYGPELSRSFRALKIWFALKEHGFGGIGKVVEQNCNQAKHLGELVAKEPTLEVLAPATLNILCFRVKRDGLSAEELDTLNEDIVADVQESGIAAPSTTRIGGKLAIRVNITNHRTRLEDMKILVDAVLDAAAKRKS